MNLNSAHMTGIFLSLAGYTLFAFADVGLKYAGQVMEVYQVAFFAQCFGLIGLFFVAKIWNLRFLGHNRKLHLFRGFCLCLTYVLIIYAFQNMSLAKAYTLFYISPFVTTLLCVPILKEKIGPFRIASICVGFLGVLVVLRPGYLALDLPSIAVLLAASFFSLTMVIARKLGPNEPALAFSFYPTICIFLSMLVFMMWDPVLPSPKMFGILAATGLIETFGSVLIGMALVRTHAVTISKFMYSGLVWAILLGWMVFGDGIDLWTVAGACIIVGSGIYLFIREKKASQTHAQTA